MSLKLSSSSNSFLIMKSTIISFFAISAFSSFFVVDCFVVNVFQVLATTTCTTKPLSMGYLDDISNSIVDAKDETPTRLDSDEKTSSVDMVSKQDNHGRGFGNWSPSINRDEANDKHNDDIKTTIGGTTSAVKIDTATDIFSSTIGNAVNAFGSGVNTVTTNVGTGISSTTNTVGTSFNTATNIFGTTLGSATSNVGSSLGNVATGFSTSIDTRTKIVGNTIGSAVNTVGSGMNTVATNVGTGISSTTNTIGTSLNAATSVVGNTIGSAANNVGSGFENVATGFSTSIDTTTKIVGDSLGSTANAVETGISTISTNVGSSIDSTATFVGNSIGIKESFENYEFGDITKKMISGYTNKTDWDFQDLTGEVYNRTLSGDINLKDVILLVKVVASLGISFTPLAGVLPLKLLIELLSVGLAQEIGNRVMEIVANEVDKRINKALLEKDDATAVNSTSSDDGNAAAAVVYNSMLSDVMRGELSKQVSQATGKNGIHELGDISKAITNNSKHLPNFDSELMSKLEIWDKKFLADMMSQGLSQVKF